MYPKPTLVHMYSPGHKQKYLFVGKETKTPCGAEEWPEGQLSQDPRANRPTCPVCRAFWEDMSPEEKADY